AMVGARIQTLYLWRQRQPDFAAAWLQAYHEGDRARWRHAAATPLDRPRPSLRCGRRVDLPEAQQRVLALLREGALVWYAGRGVVDSPAARERLLEYLAAGDTLADAAARIGVTRSTVKRWRWHDPEFTAAYEAAFDASTDVLEKEARARALDRKDGASAGLL